MKTASLDIAGHHWTSTGHRWTCFGCDSEEVIMCSPHAGGRRQMWVSNTSPPRSSVGVVPCCPMSDGMIRECNRSRPPAFAASTALPLTFSIEAYLLGRGHAKETDDGALRTRAQGCAFCDARSRLCLVCFRLLSVVLHCSSLGACCYDAASDRPTPTQKCLHGKFCQCSMHTLRYLYLSLLRPENLRSIL